MGDHDCRVYWGHCGCDLARGHHGPHVGLHWKDLGDIAAIDQYEHNDVIAHVVPQNYQYLFGEDAPDDRKH